MTTGYAGPGADAGGENGIRILFVGNSLTSWNDLPSMVETLGSEAGHRITCGVITGNNLGLEDHWRGGEARPAIREGDWDWVVLQQGPSSLPDNQEDLRVWSIRFGKKIRAAGARPALLMVWPPASRIAAFDAVSNAYARAAEAAGARLLPVGDAWRAAWRREPDLPLYGPDGFHPSPLGSYLGALVIHQELLGPPPTYPVPGAAGELPGEVHLLLRESAGEVGTAQEGSGPVPTPAPEDPD